MRAQRLAACSIALSLLAASGCGGGMTSPSVPDGSSATLMAVTPAGGAVSVDTAADIVLTFDDAMPMAMQSYVTLHHGTVTDSLVGCVRSWSMDSLTLTLTPTGMLRPGSEYTIHVGGGMRDAMGDSVGLARHGTAMGGQWATGTMMNGGGMMGGGGPMAGQEMGMGWSGGNGTYGMVFSFHTK